MNGSVSCWQDETLETEIQYFDISESSIKDKSMLGKHGEQLCDNVDVHWMIPTCDADNIKRRKNVQ